jgi:hypothetical protein
VSLNQTSLFVFLLYSVEPVMPGITMTGALPVAGFTAGLSGRKRSERDENDRAEEN